VAAELVEQRRRSRYGARESSSRRGAQHRSVSRRSARSALKTLTTRSP
jgi:hypothetical protein